MDPAAGHQSYGGLKFSHTAQNTQGEGVGLHFSSHCAFQSRLCIALRTHPVSWCRGIGGWLTWYQYLRRVGRWIQSSTVRLSACEQPDPNLFDMHIKSRLAQRAHIRKRLSESCSYSLWVV